MTVTTNYGAAPTYVKIASQSVSGVASATFNNIPQGYTDLVLIANMSMSASTNQPVITFNGTGTTLYSTTSIRGDGSAAASSRHTSQNGWYPVPGPGVGTNGNFLPWTVNIMNYSNSAIFKSGLSRFNNPVSFSSANSHLWRNTSPITSIVITMELGTFLTGTNFTLYGIKTALTPKATGGDIVVQDGQYWYHAFRTTGAFVPRQALTADVLVVAGGGGGGGTEADFYSAAGGGAGGVLAHSSQSLTATTYAVTVGAGGIGGNQNTPSYGKSGSNGSNSQFSSLTAAVGGGFGSGDAATNGGAGGSGGGTVQNLTAGAGTSGQGNAGGVGNQGGGGGGGAGGVGGSGSTPQGLGRTGGAGINTYSSWTNATNTGVSGFIAGGGGGGHTTYYLSAGDVVANGGSGGGGTGGGNRTGSTKGKTLESLPGAVNTGSGGGGGGGEGIGHTTYGGNGGSGLVIVRYPI